MTWIFPVEDVSPKPAFNPVCLRVIERILWEVDKHLGRLSPAKVVIDGLNINIMSIGEQSARHLLRTFNVTGMTAEATVVLNIRVSHVCLKDRSLQRAMRSNLNQIKYFP